MAPAPLRVCLIGCGWISANHGAAWLATPDVRLAAVCDVDEAKARARAAAWGVPAVYTDAAQMIERERPDIVDIATRPETHTALVNLAADSGANVLCQKPLAPTMEEATAMVEACERRGVRFAVLEMWRWLPWALEFDRHIRAGAIGPVHYLRTIQGREAHKAVHPVYVNQPYFRSMPRLMVYEAMIHPLDTARFLLGEVEAVFARGHRISPENAGEDMAIVVFDHAGGATSLHDASWVTPGGPPDGVGLGDVVAEGGKGVLHYSRERNTVRLSTLGGTTIVASYPDYAAVNQAGFTNCIGHFAQAVRTGGPIDSEARDNLKTLRATLAAYESMETRQVVRLT
jgi:D-apiose dehydrogenase